jgi:hypothetical protein
MLLLLIFSGYSTFAHPHALFVQFAHAHVAEVSEVEESEHFSSSAHFLKFAAIYTLVFINSIVMPTGIK